MTKNIKKIIRTIIILLITSGLIFFTSVEMVIAKPSISEWDIFDSINKERAKNNIAPLTLNNKLTQAAINKAKDLTENNYFNHNSEDGKTFSTWIKDSGYKYSFIGENLAKDFSNSESIIKAWLKSPGHKKNILNENFTETGIAVYDNVVVQIFGRSEIMPLLLEKTIGNHISENLILYINEHNRLIIHSEQNHLA